MNGGNTIRVISSQAVSLVRYSAEILKWKKDEVNVMNRKTQKTMKMIRMYHPQNSIARLYIPWIAGGQGLLSITDFLGTEEQNLSLYLDQSGERLLTIPESERNLPEYKGPVPTTSSQTSKRNKRNMGMDSKKLFGERNERLDICSTRASSHNELDKNTDGQNISEKSRMCGGRDESINYLTVECKKIAQKEYRQRHGNIARILHLE